MNRPSRYLKMLLTLGAEVNRIITRRLENYKSFYSKYNILSNETLLSRIVSSAIVVIFKTSLLTLLDSRNLRSNQYARLFIENVAKK